MFEMIRAEEAASIQQNYRKAKIVVAEFDNMIRNECHKANCFSQMFDNRVFSHGEIKLATDFIKSMGYDVYMEDAYARGCIAVQVRFKMDYR